MTDEALQAAVQGLAAVPVFLVVARLAYLAYRSWIDAMNRTEADNVRLRTVERDLNAELADLRHELERTNRELTECLRRITNDADESP